MKADRESKTGSAVVTERRRQPRYRSKAPITIRRANGAAMSGISVEISESGMSAVASGVLEVGERVELEPVAAGKVRARVRHKLGALYGFEFVGPSEEQARRIAEDCKKLDVLRRNLER